ncbi:MAG: DUF4381 family protein [Pirellulales bacterium]|nr:DUF4381 family protein [Pirellulales bacterium]
MNADRHPWILLAVLPLAVALGCGRGEIKLPPKPPRSVFDDGPVRLSVEFAPAEPRLADRATLAVRIDAEPGVTVERPEFGAEFGDFRVVDAREELPRVDNNREIVEWIYTLEPIRAGRAAIWPVDVAYVDARSTGGDGNRHWISSKPLSVEVATTVKADPPSLADLQPEAPPVGVPFSPLTWIVCLAAVLAAVAAAAYAIHRHRRRRKQIASRPLTPAEIAYRELRQIVADRLADRDVKQFYVALTGVVRRFIERTTSIRAPEQTTEEFLREISLRRTFPDEENRRLKIFLEAADLVKFAAHRPRQEDVDASLDRAREFIDARRDAMAASESSEAASDRSNTPAKEVA